MGHSGIFAFPARCLSAVIVLKEDSKKIAGSEARPHYLFSLIALYAFIVSVIAFSTGNRSILEAP
jgi:hypothetical protein